MGPKRYTRPGVTPVTRVETGTNTPLPGAMRCNKIPQGGCNSLPKAHHDK